MCTRGYFINLFSEMTPKVFISRIVRKIEPPRGYGSKPFNDLQNLSKEMNGGSSGNKVVYFSASIFKTMMIIVVIMKHPFFAGLGYIVIFSEHAEPRGCHKGS